LGENIIEGISDIILISDKPISDCYKNIYKISIQASILFDIIPNDLYVRQRKNGDSFVSGGFTKKLKKLFCDNKLTNEEKLRYPVICDGQGILWLPGFGTRDSAQGERRLYFAILSPIEKNDAEHTFYIRKP
jgi:tRNA(Ile)-lysidine synthase